MKSLVLKPFVASLVIFASTLALAQAAQNTMSFSVAGRRTLKFDIPKMDAGSIGCIAAGHEQAALQFVKKYYGADVIWADQLNVTEQHGSSLRYTTRLSANVQGTWVHQVYQVFAQYQHSCSASAQLIGESRD